MSFDRAEVTYCPSTQWWHSEENLIVKDPNGETLLYLPLQFLRQGHVLTFTYVKEQCESAFQKGGALLRKDGSRIADNDPVTAGQVIYAIEGQTLSQPRQGPRFKYKDGAPLNGLDASTISDSKRATSNQKDFRLAMIFRDGLCLLSDTLYPRCTPAHILPLSRPEYYDEALKEEVLFLYRPSFGLLLRDDLHHAFDRGEFALYPKGDDLIVHVFASDSAEMRSYHGKIIPRDRFRQPETFAPDKRLLMFHYQQCVIKYLRGYAWGMETTH